MVGMTSLASSSDLNHERLLSTNAVRKFCYSRLVFNKPARESARAMEARVIPARFKRESTIFRSPIKAFGDDKTPKNV